MKSNSEPANRRAACQVRDAAASSSSSRLPRSTALTALEHFYLTLQAAAAGVGVAIAPYAVVRDDLERGQLVAPFGFVPDGTSYHLLSRQSPEQDGRVRRLTAWLRAKTSQLKNDPEPV